ncbi:MAG: DegT/DnrJ/EryC1/StrS family aminotransferase, partial [Ignavibacteria bacterium]
TSHRETAYKSEYKNLHLPVSEDAADNSIMIPLYIPMRDEDLEHVISKIREFIAL